MRPGFLRRLSGKIFPEVGRSGRLSGSAGMEDGCIGEVHMVIGLGNPGTEYVGTRHNVGFDVVDALAAQLDIDIRKKKFGGFFGQGQLGQRKLMLLKPAGYMNRSGQAAATATGFYKLPLSRIIVVTDDMALEPGKIRVRPKGSAGGHKGLIDIISKLGSEDFTRLRVGIGRSKYRNNVDHVLTRPAGEDKELIENAIVRAQQAVISWIENGIEATMNRFN